MMSFLRNLPIARKMVVSFGIVCLLCVGYGAVNLFTMSKLHQSTTEISKKWLTGVQVLGEIRFDFSQLRRAEIGVLLCETSTCTDLYKTQKDTYMSKLEGEEQSYEKLISNEEERAFYTEMKSAQGEYLPLCNQVISLVAQGQKEQARELLLGDGRVAYEKLAAVVQKGIDLNNHGSAVASQRGDELFSSLQLLSFGVMAALVLLSIGDGWLMTRVIGHPLKLASALLGKVAGKDLTETLDLDSKDEIGEMARSLNSMVHSMREIVGSMMNSSEVLAKTSGEISESSSQSAENMREQSRLVEAAAAAAQEMSVTIAEISQHSEQAAVVSRDSAQAASHGGEVMENTSGAMKNISASSGDMAASMGSLVKRSEEIGKVVTVIREISEQTNLLALNAAIEAARAGQHGRGFAVVSEEVRRLAERTKLATEEIEKMVQAIQSETSQVMSVMEQGSKGVSDGLKHVADTHVALNSIIEMAHKTENMIAMIATAATEQASASEQISEHITNVASLAQSTTSAIEKEAEACKNLASLATNLEGVVHQFRLAGGEAEAKSSRLQVKAGAPSLQHRMLTTRA